MVRLNVGDDRLVNNRRLWRGGGGDHLYNTQAVNEYEEACNVFTSGQTVDLC